ncbi:sigma-70 family RNA polymerase sigma factor [Aeoliella sp.]|uniref:sigma-70 family RNA polymerase sigma factor n=1 Tax=Aeoliella sp. TaxID=2795800 RepID=UPI003CCBF2E4
MSEAKPDSSDLHREKEQFVQLLVGEQLSLINYITMLLADPHAANNVLQETNLVLWRKAKEFQLGTSFSAWAQKVAYWQVQAYVRNRVRDRHVFSKELIDQLANRANDEPDDTAVHVTLRHCLKNTSKTNLDLLRRRYEDGLSIAALAKRTGKSISAVKVRLMRIRQALLQCIEQNMSEAEST